MRIAYVCADPGVPVFGQKGASVHVQEVLRVLVARGHDVTLYCTRLGGTAPAGVKVVRGRSLAPGCADALAGREAAARRAAVALQRRVAADGPWDLVYERYSLWSRGGRRPGGRGPAGPPHALGARGQCAARPGAGPAPGPGRPGRGRGSGPGRARFR